MDTGTGVRGAILVIRDGNDQEVQDMGLCVLEVMVTRQSLWFILITRTPAPIQRQSDPRGHA